jgi:hypothetical protein
MMQMNAYLYELALARKYDVSDSPGFESCGWIDLQQIRG